MAIVQKTFGVIFLLVGIALLVGGAALAIFGAMDAQQHEEEQGPLGIGEDEDRTQADQAMVAGGLVAAGLGIALSIVGIVLLVSSRSRQQQQQAVVVYGTPSEGVGPTYETATVTQQQARSRAPVAIGVVLAIVVVSLLVGLAISSGDGGTPFSNDPQPTGPLAGDVYEGRLQNSGNLGLQRVNPSEKVFDPVTGTGMVEVGLAWVPADDQSSQLRVAVEVEDSGTWRQVNIKTLSSGQTIQAADPALDGARVRIVVSPVDFAFVADQGFVAAVSFHR